MFEHQMNLRWIKYQVRSRHVIWVFLWFLFTWLGVIINSIRVLLIRHSCNWSWNFICQFTVWWVHFMVRNKMVNLENVPCFKVLVFVGSYLWKIENPRLEIQVLCIRMGWWIDRLDPGQPFSNLAATVHFI